LKAYLDHYKKNNADKNHFEAILAELTVTNKHIKGISLNRPGNMFFRSLKFRAGARQIQFRRGPDHGAAMVSSARMTQLGDGKSSWGHGGIVCRVGWSLYKVNVRTTSFLALKQY